MAGLELQKHTTNESTTDASRPLVCNYLDYRAWLLAFYNWKKSESPSFSYGVLARMVGKKARNYFKLIVDGKRSLAPNMIRKVAAACQLSASETTWFVSLVHWNQCKDPTRKDLYWKELQRFSPKQDVHELNRDQLQVLTNWQALAIIEMIRLKDFRFDSAWVVRRFRGRMTIEQVEKVFETLLRLEIVTKVGDTLEVANKIHFTGGEIPSALIQMYHRQVATAGIQSLTEVEVKQREFAAGTLSISKANVEKMKKEIKRFHQRILQLAANDEVAEEVYQMNIQFFPLTKGGSK